MSYSGLLSIAQQTSSPAGAWLQGSAIVPLSANETCSTTHCRASEHWTVDACSTRIRLNENWRPLISNVALIERQNNILLFCKNVRIEYVPFV